MRMNSFLKIHPLGSTLGAKRIFFFWDRTLSDSRTVKDEKKTPLVTQPQNLISMPSNWDRINFVLVRWLDISCDGLSAWANRKTCCDKQCCMTLSRKEKARLFSDWWSGCRFFTLLLHYANRVARDRNCVACDAIRVGQETRCEVVTYLWVVLYNGFDNVKRSILIAVKLFCWWICPWECL